MKAGNERAKGEHWAGQCGTCSSLQPRRWREKSEYKKSSLLYPLFFVVRGDGEKNL